MTAAPSPSSLLASLRVAGLRLLRALVLLPPDTAGLFLGMTDDLFAVWPLEEDERPRPVKAARARMLLAA
jgi:hypothetical protein